MKRLLLTLATVLAIPLLACACPPGVDPSVDPNGGGSFSFGGGYGAYGAGGCAAPTASFSAPGYGYGGTMVAAPSYGVSFAAPSYGASFAAPAYAGNFGVGAGYSGVYAAPLMQRRVFAAPAYGYGVGRRFGVGGSGVAPYGVGVGFAAPVHVSHFGVGGFGGPVYGGFGAPVVAVPVRAVGPIRGAVRGFLGGLHNRLHGF